MAVRLTNLATKITTSVCVQSYALQNKPCPIGLIRFLYCKLQLNAKHRNFALDWQKLVMLMATNADCQKPHEYTYYNI